VQSQESREIVTEEITISALVAGSVAVGQVFVSFEKPIDAGHK
jgi:hypothetical protein